MTEVMWRAAGNTPASRGVRIAASTKRKGGMEMLPCISRVDFR